MAVSVSPAKMPAAKNTKKKGKKEEEAPVEATPSVEAESAANEEAEAVPAVVEGDKEEETKADDPPKPDVTPAAEEPTVKEEEPQAPPAIEEVKEEKVKEETPNGGEETHNGNEETPNVSEEAPNESEPIPKASEETPKAMEEAKAEESKQEVAMTKESNEEVIKAEVPVVQPEASAELQDPSALLGTPSERDVCFGEPQHKATMLLLDLIRLHYFILRKEKDDKGEKEEAPSKEEIRELATRLTKLMKEGKTHELSGLKDVPRPFLKGTGQFYERKGSTLNCLSDVQALEAVETTIADQFMLLSEDTEAISSDMKECLEALFQNTDPANKAADDPSHHSAPRPCDVLFLPVEFPWEENMPYEHQSGNKHLLFLASQHIAADTGDSSRRVEAAFKLVTAKIDVNSGTELLQKIPRFVAQELCDNQNSWRELGKQELAEFACIFTFEVYLEKQIHGMDVPLSSQVASLLSETAKPSTQPVDTPTAHDVLFGRGGMTNGHVGNRRFRDIIALHRPDYVRATKMDKPNVARRIVRAIRHGVPPGRFLKKRDDGKWYDVGDRCAAEKTSQGLRERSNAEKRQRSAQREAVRGSGDDSEVGKDGESATKKPKTEANLGHSLIVPTYVGVASQLHYTGGIPLSLSMKEPSKDSKSKKSTKKGKDGKEEDDSSESLPPNAVDKDGNILVTDYDILCGRGGLTNHHKGNKRFRDIVALHRPDYVRAPKIQKPSVARVIVRAIRNGDPPGRFLKKDEKTGKWVDVGDKKAAEKTSQALREKTGDEKERPATTPFQSPTLIVPGPTHIVPLSVEPKVENGETPAEEKNDATDDKPTNGEASEVKEGEIVKEEMEVDGEDKKEDDKNVQSVEV